ncbi:MAG TPA: MFS transporter [Alphaproteobacteria bacterium]|nr:MFS transporter [Alphaproteobacteria bacterium]
MRRWSPQVAIFLTVFVDLIGFGIVIPLLPFYAEHFSASPLMVTLLMASYSFTQFIAAPYWGRLSDRWGRKPVLLLSLGGIALSYVWIAFAGSLWQLMAARLVAGAMAGNIAAAQAYIADVTPPEKRAHGMGLIGAAFGLGFIVGPALGGLLGGPDPHHPNFLAPPLAAAEFSVVALLFAFAFLKESLDIETRQANKGARPSRFSVIAAAFRTRDLRKLVTLFFLVTFVFAGMESTFALWSERTLGWGAQQNGYIFAYTGILAALVQGGLIRRLVPRFGEGGLVVQGAIALAIGLALIAFTHALAPLLLAMALLAYGAGVANPSLSGLISLSTGRTSQGQVLGVSQSAASLARILGPACAGAIFEIAGENGPYIAGAAIMICVLALALTLPKRGARHAHGAAEHAEAGGATKKS